MIARRWAAPGWLGLLLLSACEDSLTPSPSDTMLFDFERPMFWISGGHIVKDHSVVHDGTQFHMFSIVNVLDATGQITDRAGRFAHATSPDLRNWTMQPAVLPRGDSWRELYMWAPHLVKRGRDHWMYFTGVNRHVAQCTGLAISDDLWNWDIRPDPIHHPSPDWAVWEETQWSDGRDPMVIQTDEGWVMLTTATAETPEGPRGAVAKATSRDGLQWVDAGPLLVGESAAVPESPFVLQRNGVWHLFLSWGDAGGIEHRSADDLHGDWSTRPTTDLQRGHACELLEHDGQWWMSRFDGFDAPAPDGIRIETAIRFDRIEWPADPYAAPELRRDPWDHTWTLVSGSAFRSGPAFGDNPLWRDEPSLEPRGHFYLSSIEGYHGPYRSGLPGDQSALHLGVIRSPEFTVEFEALSLWVAGDADPEGLWVRLLDATDLRVLAWTTGPGENVFREVVWETTPWQGSRVLLEVVDASPVGGISLDEVRGSHRPRDPVTFHDPAPSQGP